MKLLWSYDDGVIFMFRSVGGGIIEGMDRKLELMELGSLKLQ